METQIKITKKGSSPDINMDDDVCVEKKGHTSDSLHNFLQSFSVKTPLDILFILWLYFMIFKMTMIENKWQSKDNI